MNDRCGGSVFSKVVDVMSKIRILGSRKGKKYGCLHVHQV